MKRIFKFLVWSFTLAGMARPAIPQKTELHKVYPLLATTDKSYYPGDQLCKYFYLTTSGGATKQMASFHFDVGGQFPKSDAVSPGNITVMTDETKKAPSIALDEENYGNGHYIVWMDTSTWTSEGRCLVGAIKK